jgi:hypothetical protein
VPGKEAFMDVSRVDYPKVDSWVKKHPEGGYEGFLHAYPNFKISSWSFRKRRAKVLHLKLTPSMVPGYKGTGTGGNRRTRSAYTTVYSTPVQDLRKKNGVEAASEIIEALNRIFHLGLEPAQVEVVGSGTLKFEIRRHS